MKNIAALLRPDVRTIRVRFPSNASLAWAQDAVEQVDGTFVVPTAVGKRYTYVTHLAVQKNDIVLLPAAGALVLAVVESVDNEALIDPTDDKQYSWVVAVIDMPTHLALLAQNAEIEKTVAEASRKNLRRGFAERVLQDLDETSRASLSLLLGVSS